jgi:Protein of unknown function (DUF2752)
MKKILNYGILGILILVPIIFLILPKDYFNNGMELCPSMLLLKRECLGCGLTRGVMHLIHFDFESALYYNPLSFVMLPILGWTWGKWTWNAWNDVKTLHSKQQTQSSVEDTF